MSTCENGASTKNKLRNCAGVSKRLPRIGNVPRWMFTMTFKRGDVVVLLFPHSNLRTASRRPGLVVQRDQLATGISQTIVAMITSNLGRAGHPSRVLVSLATSEGQKSGLS